MSQWIIAGALAAGLCVSTMSGCGDTPVKAGGESGAAVPAPDSSVEQATAAPAAITNAGEKEIGALIKAAEGKVIVLNFWATWCPPCVAEMPELIQFYEKMDKDTTAFISLSADDPATSDEVVGKYREEAKVPFPVHVLDTRAPDALYGALRTEVSGALPTTIIYNKMGKVVHVWERDTTFEELTGAVEALL